jgi:Ala-tRNA(Pro) deacylase
LAKQLFLWDKKNKDSVWLVCAAANSEFDMKEFNKYLKVGSGNLRGADEDVLEKLLGCKKGMVNFFSIVNDVEKKVKLIIDQKLVDAEWASFHPMDNTGSTCIN